MEGVPHSPFKRSVHPGKKDGECATKNLLDPVTHSSEAGYAVIAGGDVPGLFERPCTSHVISDENTAEVTKCTKEVSVCSKQKIAAYP